MLIFCYNNIRYTRVTSTGKVSVSAPTIDTFMKKRLELFEWFTIRHLDVTQQFLLPTADGELRIFIDGSGLPVHYDHPGPLGEDDKRILPKHLRVRQGHVIHEHRRFGYRIGYDLSTDTIVAYDEHHQLCWRSVPITDVMAICEI